MHLFIEMAGWLAPTAQKITSPSRFSDLSLRCNPLKYVSGYSTHARSFCWSDITNIILHDKIFYLST